MSLVRDGSLGGEPQAAFLRDADGDKSWTHTSFALVGVAEVLVFATEVGVLVALEGSAVGIEASKPMTTLDLVQWRCPRAADPGEALGPVGRAASAFL